MKKIISLLIVLVLVVGLCGCEDLFASTDPANEATKITIPGTLNADNFQLSIVCAESRKTVTLNDSMKVEADSGNNFLVLCVNAKNISNDVKNLGYFLAYADNTAVLPKNVLGKYKDRALMVGAVLPGKTLEVYVMYQVPENWETFELCYVDAATGQISDSVQFGRSDLN